MGMYPTAFQPEIVDCDQGNLKCGDKDIFIHVHSRVKPWILTKKIQGLSQITSRLGAQQCYVMLGS